MSTVECAEIKETKCTRKGLWTLQQVLFLSICWSLQCIIGSCTCGLWVWLLLHSCCMNAGSNSMTNSWTWSSFTSSSVKCKPDSKPNQIVNHYGIKLNHSQTNCVCVWLSAESTDYLQLQFWKRITNFVNSLMPILQLTATWKNCTLLHNSHWWGISSKDIWLQTPSSQSQCKIN